MRLSGTTRLGLALASALAIMTAPSSVNASPTAPAGPSPMTTHPARLSSAVIAPAQASITVPRALFGMQPYLLGGANFSPNMADSTDPQFGVGAVNILSNGSEWFMVQPAPNVWHFDQLEESVTNARARGVRSINAVLTGTPAWAAELPPASFEDIPGYTSPPRDINEWRAYVRAVATRFKGRITSYQIWSEADLRNRWRGTPTELAELTRVAKIEIKAADPAALVVAASTTTRLRPLETWFVPYLRALKAKGWPVDVYVAHFYGNSLATPLARQESILKVKAALSAAGAPVKPLWDGEVNYGVAGPGTAYPHRRLDNATGAAYVARTYLDALRFGVARVYWSAWGPASPPGVGYGITMYPGYPAVSALRTTYNWVAGKSWRGCVKANNSVAPLITCRVAATSNASSPVSLILWSEGGTRMYTVPAGFTRMCLLNGRCATVKPGQKTTLGQSPVRFSA